MNVFKVFWVTAKCLAILYFSRLTTNITVTSYRDTLQKKINRLLEIRYEYVQKELKICISEDSVKTQPKTMYESEKVLESTSGVALI